MSDQAIRDEAEHEMRTAMFNRMCATIRANIHAAMRATEDRTGRVPYELLKAECEQITAAAMQCFAPRREL